MADKEKNKDLSIDNEEENYDLYGMGGGLFGSEEGDEQILAQLGDEYIKKTKGLGLDKKVDTNQGVVGEISKLLKKRSRASDAPNALKPYVRSEEALFDILDIYKEKLYEAPISVLDLCYALLLDVKDKTVFETISTYIESLGLKNFPCWEDAQNYRKNLLEYQNATAGLGGNNYLGGTYPSATTANYNSKPQTREVNGFPFYWEGFPASPPEDKVALRLRNRSNAKTPGMEGRLSRARSFLSTQSRKDSGEKNSKRMSGTKGKDYRKSASLTSESMKLATGKYKDLSSGKISFTEGYPEVDQGIPWFHGKARFSEVKGVPVIVVAEGHIICSESLPRPKDVQGYSIWRTESPLNDYTMEVVFSTLSEGLNNVRPWLKKNENKTVIGFPTEGLIVVTEGEKIQFRTFDSVSGMEMFEETYIKSYPNISVSDLLESVTYGYIRSSASDRILDTVIRKLNRLNVLDIFEDAVFDTSSQALYVLINPMLTEEEITSVVEALREEYAETELVDGPVQESDSNWWVLYIPSSSDAPKPDINRVFEPRISDKLAISLPDPMELAIKQVASEL